MNKLVLIAIPFLCLGLSACSTAQTQHHNAKTVSESRQASSLKKANKKLKHKIKNEDSSRSSSNKSSVNSQQSTTQQHNQQTNTAQSSNTGAQQQIQGKSQGEINRERGYDPNGAPLLPGQDHAAGSNPDGSPDAWVQAQDREEQFDQSHGFIGPDGRFNDAGKAYYHLDDNY